MELFRPIEAVVPRDGSVFGKPIRRLAAMKRAGLPVPAGQAMSRVQVDALLSALGAPQPSSLLSAATETELSAQVEQARRVLGAAEFGEEVRQALAELQRQLIAQGARALTVRACLVCDVASEERMLGPARLGIDDLDGLERDLCRVVAQVFDVALLRSLRRRGARDVGVSVTVHRMVDGLVSGVIYTRHPLTGDTGEWLLRVGFGLCSGVRSGQVPSDAYRLSRAGFVRDAVVARKHERIGVAADGERERVAVPAGLFDRPAVTDVIVSDVHRLAQRVERHLDGPVCVDWALAEGQLYLIRVEELPAPKKARRVAVEARPEHTSWSSQELGEAIPHALTPLTWSLLRRFSRSGIAGALAASGAALVEEQTLITEVRGQAFLNLSALTQAACRIPGISPRLLLELGLEVPAGVAFERAGVVELSRAGLRFVDAQLRFQRRLPEVEQAVGGERAHFAGLDARLLSPDAVERVLCDVESWLHDAGMALMRCYGLWVTALVALRALLARHVGQDVQRLERDLLWGPEEMLPSAGAADMLALSQSLAGDSRVRAWADSSAPPPPFIAEALLDLATAHRHEGMLLMDPASPRWTERLPRLAGALRVMIHDPMAIARAAQRVELVKGRRERAEREWKRRVPMALWPLTLALLKRVRSLTQRREALLFDAAQAVRVVREIALDASRRMSVRASGLAGIDGAFFLQLDELHALLARAEFDVVGRVPMRRLEHQLAAELPPPAQRFVGRARDAVSTPWALSGSAASGGASEGVVFRVQSGDELEALPPGAVLVVSACDVGLSPILPAVRAVVSERGGMLSHGAMLASAVGVPVVVGVEGALSRLRDGERIRVDADRAVIEREEGV